jgi:hypothetical protein
MLDKRQLLRDLLKLGVCYRARLSEQDLGVYVEMIDARMDDAAWASTMAYYCGDLGPIEQEFMPTPIELISTGNSIEGERRRRAEEIRGYQQRYEERQERERMRRLMAESDELFHEGIEPQ